MKQEESLQDLVQSLSEMVGLASHSPDLRQIKGTMDVIQEIGSLTIDVSQMVDKYANKSFKSEFF